MLSNTKVADPNFDYSSPSQAVLYQIRQSGSCDDATAALVTCPLISKAPGFTPLRLESS